jgi:hypothetical protein
MTLNLLVYWNKFQTSTQTNIDVDVINNLCLQPPLNTIRTMSCLFYTSKETIEHNSNVFHQNTCRAYTLEAIDIWHCSLPSTYELANDPSKIISLWTPFINLCNEMAYVILFVKSQRGQSTSLHGHLVYWVCYRFLLLVEDKAPHGIAILFIGYATNFFY